MASLIGPKSDVRLAEEAAAAGSAVRGLRGRHDTMPATW